MRADQAAAVACKRRGVTAVRSIKSWLGTWRQQAQEHQRTGQACQAGGRPGPVRCFTGGASWIAHALQMSPVGQAVPGRR
jgi:hypothetical protein